MVTRRPVGTHSDLKATTTANQQYPSTPRLSMAGCFCLHSMNQKRRINPFATSAIRNVNGGKPMTYRIQLDTKSQLFIAIDANNQQHQATGSTIEEAVDNLSHHAVA